MPDELIMRVLKERMDDLDCQARGWVLHGFPKTAAQAETLDKAGFAPDRYVLLKQVDKMHEFLCDFFV